MELKIVCKDEKYLPKYANDTDACMDLKITETKTLNPGESYVFGSGIQVAVPQNKVMLIYLRSSTGIKKNLILKNLVGVIDSGYRDEIKIALKNIGNEAITLQDGDRVAQFMIVDAERITLTITQDNEEFRNGDRGGGIGSTGK